jgi:arylsulfatase A-like enzyme
MTTQPNFLIICVDQMASHYLGANGCREARTPNLDRIAASGVSARRAYCPATVCMPSRAAFLTGLTPSGSGVTMNGQALDPEIPTFATRLAAGGYQTHSVGKLHLEPFGYSGSPECLEGWATGRITRLPEGYHGFQTADYLGGHGYYVFGEYVPWLHERLDNPEAWHKENRLDSWFTYEAMRNLPPEWHYNHWVADRAIDFLNNRKREPFLLWCSFPDPHHPFVASAPYRAKFDAAQMEISPTFGDVTDPLPILAAQRNSLPTLSETELREAVAETHAMIHHVDEQIGRILDRLEQTGLADNTVVAFLSDHGDYLGSHGLIKKSLWQYEELQRVPFLLRVPDAPHANWNTPVSLLDLAPTVLELAGLEAPGLAGRSLVAALREGAEPAPRPILIEHRQNETLRVRTIVCDDRKLIHYGEHGALAYDLSSDPGETVNRAGEPSFRADLDDALLTELLRTAPAGPPRLAGD